MPTDVVQFGRGRLPFGGRRWERDDYKRRRKEDGRNGGHREGKMEVQLLMTRIDRQRLHFAQVENANNGTTSC